MAIHFFTSLPQFLAPGQTREFVQGSPSFVVNGSFNGINVTPRPTAGPDRLTLVATLVTNAGGNLVQRYVVRNDNPNAGVEFTRTTVQIDPFP